MKTKEAWYAVIGGVVGAVLTMMAGSVVPTGAQDETTGLNVGEITCTGLSVVDAEGNTRIWLTSFLGGGTVGVFGKKGGGVMLNVNDNGGWVEVFDNGVNTRIAMGATEKGGSVVVSDSDGNTNVEIATTEHGGQIGVFGKGGDGKPRAVMQVNEYGNGAVSTWDKNSYRLATLK